MLVLALAVSLPAMTAAEQSASSTGDLVVFVDSGAKRQPIATFDGARWTATCSAGNGASAAAMQPARRVASRSPEWNAIEPIVKGIFSRREREQRVAVARLATVKMTLDSVYAVGPATNGTYYFEAAKQVEDTNPNADPDTDPAGLLRVRVTGWLQAAAGRVTPIASKAEVEWQQLDHVDASSRVDLLPVGTIRQRDGLVWVMKREAGNTPTFILYETGGSSVRMLLRSRC
jgi:hypothetical protein